VKVRPRTHATYEVLCVRLTATTPFEEQVGLRNSSIMSRFCASAAKCDLLPVLGEGRFVQPLPGKQPQGDHECDICAGVTCFWFAKEPTRSTQRLICFAILWTESQHTIAEIGGVERAKPLHTEELAAVARMGVSAIHNEFRALTAMSRVQYQKQLRLQTARQRMLMDGA
jgi:hypothetical protein